MRKPKKQKAQLEIQSGFKQFWTFNNAKTVYLLSVALRNVQDFLMQFIN
jgi:hypothetical protein